MTKLTTKAIPKVELHAHLEGSVPVDTVVQLANKNGVKLPPDIIKDGNYVWKTFPDFLVVYDKMCEAFKHEEDFAFATHQYLARQARVGVIYNELIISPTHAEAMDLGYESYLKGIIEGAEKAQQEFGIVCRLIATIVRGEKLAGANKVIELLKANPHPMVTGLHIAGDETCMNLSDFAEHYKAAGDMGLGLTAHAGEIRGPDEVRAALDLGVSRIGHGVASIKDPALVKLLAQNKICLEVCPTSNIRTATHFPTYEEHPLRKLYDAGVLVTLNSDDPPFFDSWIEKEYQIAQDRFGFSDDQLKQLGRTALECAFVDDSTRNQLLAKIPV